MEGIGINDMLEGEKMSKRNDNSFRIPCPYSMILRYVRIVDRLMPWLSDIAPSCVDDTCKTADKRSSCHGYFRSYLWPFFRTREIDRSADRDCNTSICVSDALFTGFF